MLSGYRILDLTDVNGFFCAKILADLGADVIKIERPGGDPSRHIGPFYHDIPDSEMSLYWFAYNANKWGITLNIECAQGKEIFNKLVQTADVVVESFPPGYMDKLGLGYTALSTINPRIIMTSITPFGQQGPYKDFIASDMVVMAMGGWAYLCGEPGRPPVTIGFPQSYLCAAGDAAVGTATALYFRELSGQGQHVDVSAQQSVVMDTREATAYWFLSQIMLGRSSPYRVGFARAGVKQRWLWKCQDGFIIWLAMGGMAGARENRTLVEWMDSEGMTSDFLKQVDWQNWDIQQATTEFFEQMETDVGHFFLSHTKAELFDGALKKGIIIYPVSTVSDLMGNAQLKARDFWIEVDHAELEDRIAYPGPFIKPSETLWPESFRAPLIGEHNVKIYKQVLGFSDQQLVTLKQAGVI